MRGFRIAVLSLAAVAMATSADAQSRRKRGNEDQQSPGYDNPVPKQEKRFPVGAAWVLVSLNGKTYTGTQRPSFKLDQNLHVSGYGGCNSFATVAYPLKDQAIAVGPLALTKKSCDKSVMEAEHAYLVALRTAAKWDTQIGTLIISGPNGELRFERSL